MVFKTNIISFKMAILENGYGYKELIKKSGLSSRTISKVYSGQSVHAKTAKRIADALGKPVTELFTVE